MMFGAAPIPSTDGEKAKFVFTRYDKDGDGFWKFAEFACFMQEIKGEALEKDAFADLCQEWDCDVPGPELEHLEARYKANPAVMEQEFGMCLGLSACIA